MAFFHNSLIDAILKNNKDGIIMILYSMRQDQNGRFGGKGRKFVIKRN
jgi:hypothetical protein